MMLIRMQSYTASGTPIIVILPILAAPIPYFSISSLTASLTALTRELTLSFTSTAEM
ncbi:hypothetical protein SAMN04487996_101291 [Dyadobacter soli]|uniref:Uncharacterized protein n=1 Tax=Dyadobacter soli TaxID=659014 RepID=A0A1G6VMM7_9BACT|nr:hypothetical protein SAMN04487996_101291 [Dyadobacter soli]